MCSQSQTTEETSGVGVGADVRHPEKEPDMLRYALTFLVVGLIAGVLGLTGVAAVATQISWWLFVMAIILLAIHLGTRRTARIP